jgi:hypothetical protein
MTVDADPRVLANAVAPSDGGRRALSALAIVGVVVAAVVAVFAWQARANAPTTYQSPQAMAERLGCSQTFVPAAWATDASTPLVGTCTSGGVSLTLATFPSKEAAQAWSLSAMQFGPKRADGTAAITLISGENWAVASAETFGDAVGQKLQAPQPVS